jgi:tRNA(fMet)-specific endonuclease VapC
MALTHVLDTSICLALLGGQAPAEALLALNPQDLGVPSVVRAELLLTARVSQRPIENTRLVEAFLRPLVSLPFDEPCAEEYALLRADFPQTSLGPTDLATVATALGHRLRLLTANPGAFASIVRLKVESLKS